MGMPALAHDWTAEMVRAMPEDGNRYEVVDGELFVTPAPVLLHQLAIGELHLLLADYLREYGLGDVVVAPADIEINDRTLVEPDLFVIPELKAPVPRYLESASQLVIEGARLERCFRQSAAHDRSSGIFRARVSRVMAPSQLPTLTLSESRPGMQSNKNLSIGSCARVEHIGPLLT